MKIYVVRGTEIIHSGKSSKLNVPRKGSQMFVIGKKPWLTKETVRSPVLVTSIFVTFSYCL